MSTVLFDEFPALRSNRAEQDASIEAFFARMEPAFLERSFPYINNAGRHYIEAAPVAIGHFFNHQTHHRGQVHVMLRQTPVQPPSLDLHRIVNP